MPELTSVQISYIESWKVKVSIILENTQWKNGCKIKMITVYKNRFSKHLKKLESSCLVSITNKGNNKITELRTILQRESQNS
jgi:hypothetical protein